VNGLATTPRQSGFLIQSTFGRIGNFEVVVPRRGGGLKHHWRDNDSLGLPWRAPAGFGSGSVTGTSLIQGSFGGNFELVTVEGGRIAHYWREGAPPFIWSAPFRFGSGVSGRPALIQGTFGSPGNFEVVVPRQGGGLVHYWRDNNDPGLPWSGPTRFGRGNVSGAGLIHGGFGQNLEVVAVEGNRLAHYWREGEPPFGWSDPFYFGDGVTGSPGFAQGTFGQAGNFEVVVPRQGGGLAHYWRNNDDPGLPWSGPTPFGRGNVSAATLIQSNFGQNLEVVAVEGNRLAHYWRESRPPFSWSGPFYVPEECVFVHSKVLVAPTISVDTMFASMREVYAAAGFVVEESSRETLSLPDLEDVDVGECRRGNTTGEQNTLFGNRNNVGANDVVIYFVRSTVPAFNGCAAHPANRPGAVVVRGATRWTMAHEIGHVLGLNHVDDNNRLMTGNGTGNITNPPPDVVASEISTMAGSASTEPC
jgi:hypothetical protein